MKRASVELIGTEHVALLGLPWDEHSSFLRGAADAPRAVREALASPSSNWFAENGFDLEAESRFVDLGDLTIGDAERAFREIEQGVARAAATGASLILLGGDHAVTYPAFRGYATAHVGLEILHLDAHPDLYDDFEGDRLSHACPFARILEERLARRIVQVGIRTMTSHQREQTRRFGVEVVEMSAWRPHHLPAFEGPVYLSLDLDVLDPAFAPGVSHHEPGGLSTREVIGIVQGFAGRLVGADIVELNPRRDPLGITAMAAAKLVKEIAARLFAMRASR